MKAFYCLQIVIPSDEVVASNMNLLLNSRIYRCNFPKIFSDIIQLSSVIGNFLDGQPF